MPHTYDYPRPMVTVDTVVIAPGEKQAEVLLIRRKHDPFEGKWALPGGFLDLDEELEDAAARELREETGVEAGTLRQIGAFGTIGRDPRGRTIGVAFLALLENRPCPQAGDDAAEARWFPIDGLPDLAFDHDDIMKTALSRITGGLKPRDI
jgi:8-oxo-dGTP diphosphatase